MLDSNGYSKSLLASEYCFFCGKGGDLARHEAFGGNPDRETSKAVGMWCTLCPTCHERVHTIDSWTETLHKEAQLIFEHEHSHEEFKVLFGKNYL